MPTLRLSPRSEIWLCAMDSLLRAEQWCRELPRPSKALFFSTRVLRPLISFKPVLATGKLYSGGTTLILSMSDSVHFLDFILKAQLLIRIQPQW